MHEKILKINDEQQKVLLRFFARVDFAVRISIFEAHKKLFFELHHKYKEELGSHILSYAALVLAIGAYRDEAQALKKHDFSAMSLDKVKALSYRQASLFSIKNSRRSKQRERLIGYWAIVQTLKNEHGYSFRKIVEYLKAYQKFEVAHSTVYLLWSELEVADK